MRKIVDKVTSHGKNFNTGDFAVMVCPECATLYENPSPRDFSEKHKFYIKRGRQVMLQCKNCDCRFERKVYNRIAIRWKKLFPVIFVIIALIMFTLFFIAIFCENQILLTVGLLGSVLTGGIALCSFMDVEIF